MKRLLLLIILFYTIVWAESDFNSSSSVESNISSKVEAYRNNQINELRKRLTDFESDKKLFDNEWTKTYSAFIAHKELLDKKNEIEKEIKHLKSLKYLTDIQTTRLKKNEKEYKVLSDKLNLVKEFEKEPFQKIIAPPKLLDTPKITNPFSIISGFSYIKELKNKRAKYLEKFKSLDETIINLQKKKSILQSLYRLSNIEVYKKKIDSLNEEIKELLTVKDIFKTTKDIYFKKTDESIVAIENDIKRELEKAISIGAIALIFLFLFIGSKLLTRKYLSDKESYYTVNKVINFIFITILVIMLLLAYLENVSYLVTILGFASAGIAIAMKDWFMSLMGWFVIIIGGAIHVGDRVKFTKDGVEYVGDVVDISLLRMTIQEDVTLTTYMYNRRAGRIIFIPNNYIFTDMVANYSHSGLKTVWDGIDFYITYDSNIQKATTIAKNITKQYSKGYTDITRKQLNKLRSKYQLKNTNVEPRIFSFIEGYGMKISVWYLTNAYATLTLRSTISTKIIEELLKEDDIKMAYPTQSIYHDSGIPKPKEIEDINEEVKDV